MRLGWWSIGLASLSWLSFVGQAQAHAAQDTNTTPASSEQTPAAAPTTADPSTVQPDVVIAPAPASSPSPAPADPPPARAIRFTGSLGAISLPRLLSLELLARFRRSNDPKWDLFALGAGIEYLPPGIVNFGDLTTLSWFQVGPEGRFFLYRWLFVGARVGWQFTRADSEKFGSEVDYVTTSLFLAPKVGALYTFASGFTIGGDLGVSIPMFADTSITSDGTQDSNARKASKTFGGFVMPALSLRIGWTI